MRKFKRSNDGHEVLLVKVDTFSKQLNVVPLLNKGALETLRGMREIVRQVGTTPKNLFTDKGTEFLNAPLAEYFKDQNIHHYTANDNKSGAAGAERVIRTLKGRIYRYLTSRTEKPANRYIDALPQIVDALNHSIHRSIGMAPADVRPEHVAIIRQRLYPEDCPERITRPRFKLGDVVRKQIMYAAFHKGYKGDQFTIETFKISEVQSTDPVTYKLVENLPGGSDIMGSFYEQQLLLVLSPPPPPRRPIPDVLPVVQPAQRPDQGLEEEAEATWPPTKPYHFRPYVRGRPLDQGIEESEGEEEDDDQED
jgi:hypothetical protein